MSGAMIKDDSATDFFIHFIRYKVSLIDISENFSTNNFGIIGSIESKGITVKSIYRVA
ncbi:hypothetical protein D9M68_860190 [compost metagenome]